MATTRPFARNTGGNIPNTEQVGNIAVGDQGLRYDTNPGGVKWWMGPDEDNRYVVAKDVPAGNYPTPDGNVGTMEFWACNNSTNTEYITLVNGITGNQFASSNTAYNYLNSNGYWTNYTAGTQSVPSYIPTSPTASPVWLFYLPYTEKINYMVFTDLQPGQEFGIWGVEASNPTVSSSLFDGLAFREINTLSPDGKKALIPFNGYSGSEYTYWNGIGMYDGETGIFSTSSMAIPGSSSQPYYHWSVNTSYDTLRNEFLVPGTGFTEGDGSPYGPGYNKILRYATGSSGIEYVGYYQVSCSYYNTQGNFVSYTMELESVHYNESNDQIYYTTTTPTTAEFISGSVLKSYDIGTGQNSSVIFSYWHPGAGSYNGWGQHSPAYHEPTNKLFVREAYNSSSLGGILDFAVYDITNNTYTYPSQSLYRKSGIDTSFNQQVMNILIPQKDAYAYFNSEDIWGIDVYNYSPKFQISGSVNSEGNFNNTMTVNTRYTYDSTNENFWISFSALKVFNTYDLSAI